MIEDNQENDDGLSVGNRNFIVTIVAVILLIFGPIELFVYSIVILVLVWLALRHWGGSWKMDKLSNDRLERALFGGIAGALIIGVYLSLTANYHTECDQYVRTRDGSECVGDYVTVKGPDKSGAFIEIIFAGIAAWYAISKRSEEN